MNELNSHVNVWTLLPLLWNFPNVSNFLCSCSFNHGKDLWINVLFLFLKYIISKLLRKPTYFFLVNVWIPTPLTKTFESHWSSADQNDNMVKRPYEVNMGLLAFAGSGNSVLSYKTISQSRCPFKNLEEIRMKTLCNKSLKGYAYVSSDWQIRLWPS